MASGKLVNIGPSVISTGGAVANTGIALHKLGIDVKLMGKVGDDWYGDVILSLLRKEHEALADDMIVAKGEHSSYSIVISPPQTDRMFLHCTGSNDTLSEHEVAAAALQQAAIFHFGYPPLMRRMYEHEGAELAALFHRAKAAGAVTSLDMARPDPDSPAGEADWRKILAAVLPHVDLFFPSVEEILYMTKRETYKELQAKYGDDGPIEHVGIELLRELALELIDWGAAVVVLKLGEHGLYMRSSGSAERMERTGHDRLLSDEEWLNRELYAPCYNVEVAGTTGAGDCTIAGFLAGLIRGLRPDEVMLGAVAVGAYNVEQYDATSGIPNWEQVQSRIRSGWEQRLPHIRLKGEDRLC
jgi:sugar/nucleoside kinase (ribokinase family)